MPALDLFAANVLVHFRFFRRNRLLLAVALVFLLFFGLSMLGAILWGTSGGRFAQLQGFSMGLNQLVQFLTPALGLVLIWSHLRDRNLKMVVTKPCPPEIWLLSGLLTAAAISWVLHLGVFLVTQALSLAWGLPLQGGFAFVGLDSFVRSLISLGYLSLLAMLFHPVLALLLISLLNESSLYGLKYMLSVGSKAHPGNLLFAALGRLCDALYFLVPMIRPFAEQTKDVYSSLRATPADWLYLLSAAGYAGLVTGVFALLCLLVLRRRSLI